MFLQQKILISRDEDISSIVEKLVSAWGDEIFLIIPDKAKIFGHFSDVQILKEEAENLRKRLAIITPDFRGQKICLDIGLPVMDLDRIEITKEKTLLDVGESKKVFDIAPVLGESETFQRSSRSMTAGKEEVLTGESKEEPVETPSYPPIKEEVEKFVPEEPSEYRYELPAQEKSDNLLEEKIAPPRTAYEYEEEGLEEKERRISDFFRKLKPAKRVVGFSFKARILVSFVGAAGIVFLAALFLVLPKAEIFIETRKDPVIFDFSLTVDKNIRQIDVEKGVIPGQIAGPDFGEKKVEFPASGKKFLEAKASGKILIFNAYSSAPQSLVQNTRFMSKEGKLFRLTRAITVPGAGVEGGRIIPRSVEAEVVADQIGEEYNIGPTTFTIPGFQGSPKYEGFYAESRSPMTGGAKGEVRVATADDIEKAKSEVFKDLSDALKKDFIAKLPAGLKLVDGATEIKVTEQIVSVRPDTRADNFSVIVKISVSAFLFAEKDLKTLVKELAIKKIMEDKEIVSTQEEIKYKTTKPDFTKGIMRLDIEAKEAVQTKIDVEQLKKDLAGKSQRELESLLSSLPGLENSLVKLWPFWIKSVPKNPDKIEIIVK